HATAKERLQIPPVHAATRQTVPIQATNTLVQTLSERLFRFQSEQLAGRIVQVGDSTFRVSDDDPFLNRIENCLEKTFLMSKTQKIILHVLRPDLAEATNQFFNEPGFHNIAECKSAEGPLSSIQNLPPLGRRRRHFDLRHLNADVVQDHGGEDHAGNSHHDLANDQADQREPNRIASPAAYDFAVQKVLEFVNGDQKDERSERDPY